MNQCKSEKKKINVFIDHPANANFSIINHSKAITFKNLTIGGRNYMWDFGDGNYDTMTNPTHTYPFFGSYTVKLIAFNGCGSDTFTKKITVSSIAENKPNSELYIYPNPANENIYVKILSGFPDVLELKLINTLNQVVFEKKIVHHRESIEIINVSRFPAGMYFIKLNGEQETLTKKILIE